MASRLLNLLLCALLIGPMSSSAWAIARPETCVGEFFPASLKSAAADLAQPIDPRPENPACGYDFASGVCKYLYGADDPVNNVDPSGEFSEGIMGFMSFASISPIFAQISNPVAPRVQQRARQVASNRPSSRAFWEVYPDYRTFIASMVWDLVGGSIGADYGSKPETDQMSCATRVSHALNEVGGNEIPKLGDPKSPNTPPRSIRNSRSVSWHGREGDNKNYIVSAGDMKEYLLQKWGKEDAKIYDVPKLKQFTAGLRAGQIAVFATPGPSGRGHAGVLMQGYQDPYVEGYLVPIWVWALSTP